MLFSISSFLCWEYAYAPLERRISKKLLFKTYLTHLIFCVKTNLSSCYLKEKYLISSRVPVRYLLRPSITVKSVVLFWCKSYHEVRRFPPINDSELPFCFWDLIWWKPNKRLWNINWHRWNWLAKINTKTSSRIGGGIFTSKKENSISNIDDLSLSKEKIPPATTLQK